MQMKCPKKNYPIHKKDMLAIICALKKWHSDLPSIPIMVYTDLRMLENFNTQCDLSHHQLQWQEFMSQYDMIVVYISGEENMVTNALSHIPEGGYPGETTNRPFQTNTPGIHTTLSITTDPSIPCTIQAGYNTDEFCKKVIASVTSIQRITTSNGLWYIRDHLLIPCFGTLQEDLFHLAHDVVICLQWIYQSNQPNNKSTLWDAD
jgi:hypothetical protein